MRRRSEMMSFIRKSLLDPAGDDVSACKHRMNALSVFAKRTGNYGAIEDGGAGSHLLIASRFPFEGASAFVRCERGATSHKSSRAHSFARHRAPALTSGRRSRH